MRKSISLNKRNEIVVRTLVREWLNEAADIEDSASAAAAVAVSKLSDLESLSSELDSALADAEEQVAEQNEALGAAFFLGGLMALPTLVKWSSNLVSVVAKAFAGAARKAGASGLAKGSESMGELVKELGMSVYEKGHHMIQGAFVLFVKSFLLAGAALGGRESAAQMQEWMDGPGKKTVTTIATTLELAVTCYLAVASGVGAYHAAKHAATTLAGVEGILTAVKAGHIIEAVGLALTRAGALMSEAFSQAGVSFTNAADAKSKIKAAWESVTDNFIKGAQAVQKSAE